MKINFDSIEPREVIDSQRLNDIFDITGSLTLNDENIRHGGFQRRHFEEGQVFNQAGSTISTGSFVNITSSIGWETVQSISQTNVFGDTPEVFRCNFQAEVTGSTITGNSLTDRASQFALFRVVLDGVGQIGNIFTLGAHGITNGDGGNTNSKTIYFEKLLHRAYYFHDGQTPFTSSFFRLEGRVANNGLAGVNEPRMTIALSNRYGFGLKHKY